MTLFKEKKNELDELGLRNQREITPSLVSLNMARAKQRISIGRVYNNSSIRSYTLPYCKHQTVNERSEKNKPLATISQRPKGPFPPQSQSQATSAPR
jgi:hypothetical protein